MDLESISLDRKSDEKLKCKVMSSKSLIHLRKWETVSIDFEAQIIDNSYR